MLCITLDNKVVENSPKFCCDFEWLLGAMGQFWPICLMKHNS